MRGLARIVLAISAVVVAGCSRAVYMPSKKLLGWPHQKRDEIWMTARDGTRLHAWRLHADSGKARGTFVQFHGNAGNMTSHFASLEWVTRYDYDLFAFDYRGYGESGGDPDQRGVNQDAIAAIETAQALAPERQGQRDLVLYGQSLGGAVLLRALDDVHDKHRIRAVVVEGTFHSYQDIAASVLWRVPVLLPFSGLAYALVSDAYAPDLSARNVSPLPLLVIHDLRDPVVPFGFGLAVYRLAREPKELWPVDDGAHCRATANPVLQRLLVEWIERGLGSTSHREDGVRPRGERDSFLGSAEVLAGE